jgi:Cd2+/Zn2+-exporting ATPase
MSRKEGFEPHKARAFKIIMGKALSPKCLVVRDETVYVGRHRFIKGIL